MTLRFASIAAAVLGLLGGGCDRPDTPLVLACTKVTVVGTADGALKRCRCADRLLRRQLDPDAYDALSSTAAAIAAVPEGTIGATGNLHRFVVRTDVIDTSIASADLAIGLVKAAQRCPERVR